MSTADLELPEKYRTFMENYGLQPNNLVEKTTSTYPHIAYDKQTGNLVVPKEHLGEQKRLLLEYLKESPLPEAEYKIIKPLLFDAAFKLGKNEHTNGLQMAIYTFKVREALDMVKDAKPDQLCLGVPPDLCNALDSEMLDVALAIVRKEGVKIEDLLRHYPVPQTPHYTSNSLSDALYVQSDARSPVTRQKTSELIDELIDCATSEQLRKKFTGGSSVLEVAIDIQDEKHAVAIVKKCFKDYSDREKISFLHMAKNAKNNQGEYAMPELVATMESFMDKSFMNFIKNPANERFR